MKKNICHICRKNKIVWSSYCDECLEKLVQIARERLGELAAFESKEIAEKRAIRHRENAFRLAKQIALTKAVFENN
jgi:UTP:GlnB (protein PII) uridylyltransferase